MCLSLEKLFVWQVLFCFRLSSEREKCWSPSQHHITGGPPPLSTPDRGPPPQSSPDPPSLAPGSTSSTSSSQRIVTFNDKNEVASQDSDGSFTVTYSQLGQRLRPQHPGTCLQTNSASLKNSSSHQSLSSRKQPGLRVQFGERSAVETVELPFKLIENVRNVTFDEDSLLSYKRWVDECKAEEKCKIKTYFTHQYQLLDAMFSKCVEYFCPHHDCISLKNVDI